ncbi:RidA family protein [Halorussus marinus]|uniref:RidA family protein n=1 Tax=Halorussus marinus TaxID=2505976 RepID=UPI0010925DFD|nr:RidA family protein [Halorussus marinus]
MEVVKPNNVYDSSAPNSRAVVQDDTVYVSGVVGIDPETGEYGDTMAEQTRNAFENISATLEEAESSLDQVLRFLVFITDGEKKPEMDEVFEEYLDEPYPTRAAVISDLGGDEAMVEIVVTAYR